MESKKDIVAGELKKQTSVQKKNAISVFMNKKTEKIAAAVYMLTDLIPVSDPLRSELRKNVLELLSVTFSGDESEQEIAVRLSRKLLSLLQVAQYARLISEMNCNIFRREIETLIGHIESRYSRAGELYLPGVFFQVESLAHVPDATEKENVFYKGQNKRQESLMSLNVRESTRENIQGQAFPESNKNMHLDKKDRKEEILNFFRTVKRADVSIKDISAVIRDCSEKTIQRELIDSVQKGILKKDGERRWSRYSLVS